MPLRRRQTQEGEYLPVAPLQCCGMCLAPRPPAPRPDCTDLSRCSGHGVCELGACECFEGWGGPDCAAVGPGGGDGDGLPWWEALLLACSMLVLSACVLALRRAIIMVLDSGGPSGTGARCESARG